jgi:hypothetical protein
MMVKRTAMGKRLRIFFAMFATSEKPTRFEFIVNISDLEEGSDDGDEASSES